jgi:hypothetical protein
MSPSILAGLMRWAAAAVVAALALLALRGYFHPDNVMSLLSAMSLCG